MIESVMSAIIIGFGIGFMGSFHCIGMCGPIALSLPVHGLAPLQKTSSIVLYNIGRAFMYAFMGLIFGYIGSRFSIFGLQEWLSILAGVSILVILMMGYYAPSWGGKFAVYSKTVKKYFEEALKGKKTNFSYFKIGFINGLLPCGLVYVGIAAATATGSVLHSALLMFAFGLGTLPLMASLMVVGNYISLPIRRRMNQLVPVFIAVLAVLLIVRGLNLGIPYLSPAFHYEENCVKNCCHKN